VEVMPQAAADLESVGSSSYDPLKEDHYMEEEFSSPMSHAQTILNAYRLH